ncbi:MAG TPA: Gfo/Idh/MocA family oxidoreductase [Longimicrobiales bacterium]
MTEPKRVRTAVVGCGYWGKNLVRNFAALSDLRACCDASEEVRGRLAAQLRDVRVTDAFEAVLDAPDVDAVVLATPAAMHADMAIAALEAGKHVFVEKPLALSVADAERAAAAADRCGRILMVGHLLEYHPAVNYLKELIDAGELGDVYYCYGQRVNLGKLRSDENALWSLAPHDISIVLYLMGEEPEEVEATGQAFLQPGIEDVVFLTLKFGSGRVAHIQVSWLDPHKARRLTVVGSKKMVVFDDMQPQEKVRIYDKGVDRRPGEAAPYASYGELLSLREGDIVIPRIPEREPLAIECEAFLKSVLTGIPPRSDAQDGVRVVRVLAAAQAKLADGHLAFHAAAS